MLQTFNAKNRDLLININGELIHRDKAGISPFDSAVQGGDAVWEGLRLYNGHIFKLTEHLDRLTSSAKALAFAEIPTRDAIIAEITKTLAANRMTDGVHIRLTLTRGTKITSGMDPRLNQAGPTLIVLAEFKSPVYRDAVGDSGLSLITRSIRRFAPDAMDPKIHHCNLIQSIMAKIEANHAGADDAVMLDPRGFMAETNATHVFIVTNTPNGPLVETSRCAACPEGITRETVLELCAANGISHAERDISMTEVYRADECFTAGTMGELAPVASIDGRSIGTGDRPITAKLSALYTDLTAREGTPVVE